MIKRLSRFKVYIDRARWYYVLIQFFIIVLIYFNTKGYTLSWWHYPVIFIVVIATMIIAGYLDRRIGVLREEQRFYSTENPVLLDILEQIKELKK